MGNEYSLSKLFGFMAKVAPEDDSIIFFDDGSKLVLQVNAGDSQSVTAILPSSGKSIKPVALRRSDFLKAYRNGAKFSGSDGKLNMSLGHWRMALAGSVEAKAPEPVIIEGKRIVADVAPLKSVPTEDTYGGSTWAIFLPDGLAALTSTYSMVCVIMDAEVWPKKTVSMQANAIYPMVNLVDPRLTVAEEAVGIQGKYPVGNGVDADIYIALAKPVEQPPSSDDVRAMVPDKAHKLSVSAGELRQCIEGAKKTFGDEATSLTFSLTEAGLAISLQSDSAALTETVTYLTRPEKTGGKLVINTDVAVNAFKGMRELTSDKVIACMKWDDTAVSIRIVDAKKKMLGAIVIAASED